jgi:hypothetical protein
LGSGRTPERATPAAGLARFPDIIAQFPEKHAPTLKGGAVVRGVELMFFGRKADEMLSMLYEEHTTSRMKILFRSRNSSHRRRIARANQCQEKLKNRVAQ